MPKEIEATEVAKLFVVEFGERPDGGPLLVGPFTSEEAAQTAMSELGTGEWVAEGSIVSLAAVAAAAEEAPEVDMPVDEPDEGEELNTLIPVHGVSTVEGRPTGDGRGFRAGAIDIGSLPQPLGFEFESSHGGDNSRVAVIGHIAQMSKKEIGEGVFEVRWQGYINTLFPYASQAIEGILDGSYVGGSVIVDSVTVDVTEQREAMRERILADQARSGDSELDDEPHQMSSEEIEELLDVFVGDGEQDVTWFSAARQRRLDMVPTGAFIEAYTNLGWEFEDELTPEAVTASMAALEDCGCLDGLETVDLTLLSVEEIEEYDGLDADAQLEYARERGAIVASAEALAPGTHDGPGWITNPLATARIRRYWTRGKGAAKIRWGVPGDFNRCRTQLAKYVQNPDWLAGLCANMHKEAIGVWPGQEDGGRKHHSLVASGAAQAEELFHMVEVDAVDAALFADPHFSAATGIDMDGDHITGYIAVWNACHIGRPDRCTLAPRSNTNYGFYRTGKVKTTEGYVPVGQITMATGHAGEFLGPREAASHYDNTGFVFADVACGEDSFGIWFSGRIRPDVSEEDRFAVLASGRISGDWREIPGVGYELVAGLVVNTPGFGFVEPALVAGAQGVTAILAAGVFEPEDAEETKAEPVQFTAAEIVGLIETTIDSFVSRQDHARKLDKLAPIRQELRTRQLAAARAHFATIEG
jgi:hypothetical protein